METSAGRKKGKQYYNQRNDIVRQLCRVFSFFLSFSRLHLFGHGIYLINAGICFKTRERERQHRRPKVHDVLYISNEEMTEKKNSK